MKKFAILAISLLVLIIGVACASATGINGTIDDSIQAVDYQCGVDEIDSSSPDIVQDDAVSLNDANEIDRPSCDVVQDSVVDNSIADSTGDVIVAPDAVKDIDGSNLKLATDMGDISNSTVTVENSTMDTSTQNQSAPNIIDDTPKETDTSAQKQNSLRPDIAKYNKYFQKNHLKTMPNGKTFSEMDLLLEISKHYSFEDTVIIALHVLRDNGVRVTFTGLEAMLKQMGDGTVYTLDYQNNASYYKDEMQKIHESHKELNVKAKKYSDLFKDMDAKIPSEKIKGYLIYDFIAHVYKDTFDKQQTALIAAYALKDCGYNVTVGSIENTLNQMIQGSISIDNGHSQTYMYNNLFKVLDILHGIGYDQKFIDLQYNNFIELRNVKYA